MKKNQDNSGFKVPDGYFDTFTQRLGQKLSEKESDIPKDSGFSVPDGYFESLHERLLQRMNPEGGRVIQLRPYKKYFLAAAAVAAIVVLFVMLPREHLAQPSFADLAGTDIANYMESSELDFTYEEIAQLFPVEDMEMGDMMQSRLNEENIMDYLDMSMEDYEELNLGIDETYQ